MSKQEGTVRITHHGSRYMYDPLMSDITASKLQGSTCVLTQTNEEAVTVMALLRRQGIVAKLIQTMGDLRFCNLAEVRYFAKCLARHKTSPVISEEAWTEAKDKTFAKIQTEHSPPLSLQMC